MIDSKNDGTFKVGFIQWIRLWQEYNTKHTVWLVDEIIPVENDYSHILVKWEVSCRKWELESVRKCKMLCEMVEHW